MQILLAGWHVHWGSSLLVYLFFVCVSDPPSGEGVGVNLVAPDFHAFVDPVEYVLVAVVDLALVFVLSLSVADSTEQT